MDMQNPVGMLLVLGTLISFSSFASASQGDNVKGFSDCVALVESVVGIFADEPLAPEDKPEWLWTNLFDEKGNSLRFASNKETVEIRASSPTTGEVSLNLTVSTDENVITTIKNCELDNGKLKIVWVVKEKKGSASLTQSIEAEVKSNGLENVQVVKNFKQGFMRPYSQEAFAAKLLTNEHTR